MDWRSWLEWEEGAFRAIYAGVRRLGSLASRQPEVLPGTIFFDEVERPMSILAQLISGEALRVRRGPGVGGLRGLDLLLPANLALDGDPELNRDAYRVQVIIQTGRRRLLAEAADGEASRSDEEERYEGALASLELTGRAIERMVEEWPHFRALYDRVLAPIRRARLATPIDRLSGRERILEEARRDALAGGTPWTDDRVRNALRGLRPGTKRSPGIPVWGTLMTTPKEASNLGVPAESENGVEPETEELAPDVGSIRLVEFDEGEEERDAPPDAAFERAESLDSYTAGQRSFDGADELEAHLDALDEVELGDLFRGGPNPNALLKADLDLGIEIADGGESEEGGIRYDEWDGRKGCYRKDWCTVHPVKAPLGDAAWAREGLATHRKLTTRLRRQLEAFRSGLRSAPRQLDGEEIDLSAALDEHVARASGRSGDPRVYQRAEKRRRDIATLVLLDASMSTDSWVEGRRVLDVSREAALVLGEVSHQLEDRIEIMAFASETRNHCHVWSVYQSGSPWSEGQRRLAGIEPRGYTRIGPALRHATRRLARTPAKRRLLLLISDGKPTDYDRYEGRYGIADVRQAIREAQQQEIHTHALAVDQIARDTLPALFGMNGWNVLKDPDELPEALALVYGRLTAR